MIALCENALEKGSMQSTTTTVAAALSNLGRATRVHMNNEHITTEGREKSDMPLELYPTSDTFTPSVGGWKRVDYVVSYRIGSVTIPFPSSRVNGKLHTDRATCRTRPATKP